MHIKEAKKQIQSAIIAYSTKDQYGRARIPVSKQRPVFLVGAPGIGKTAIVEQIAAELNLGFVSYSMTHHTRQSALGLPFIVDKEYGGKKYSVSEYTMSEIIASVYDEMEKTGKKEGVLFLDEINCVSETLAPSMLQFLQYKTFGRHQVPDGWIVVTAGNPPEYNDSVRQFDIAMLDRLKKIEVEPDYPVWKEFALQTGVHPVILSYLEIKTQYFYRVMTTVEGKSFVTARAWDDLSQMITLYEENDLTVDSALIGQYIQDEQIARDFANYYDLYRKYQADYQILDVLNGTESEMILKRANNAAFDERLSLISLIISSLDERISTFVQKENILKTAVPIVSKISEDYEAALENLREKYLHESEKTDTKEHVDTALGLCTLFEELLTIYHQSGWDHVKASLKEQLAKLKEQNTNLQNMLENVFVFFEKAFGNGQEMLILVSELTVRPASSKYIFAHGCPKYFVYNKQLLFDQRNQSISDRIDALNLLELD